MNLRPFLNWIEAGNPLWVAVQIALLFVCICWMIALALSGLWVQESYTVWGAMLGAVLGLILGMVRKNPITDNHAINVITSVLILALVGAFAGTLFSRNDDVKQMTAYIGWGSFLLGMILGVFCVIYVRRRNK